MTVIRNRFPELIEAVRQVTDEGRMRSVVSDALEQQQEVAEGWLYEFSPRKSSRTFMTTGHRHTSISEGWRTPPIEVDQDGGTAKVTNVSEHIEAQRYGARGTIIYPRHSISYAWHGKLEMRYFRGTLGGRLYFWIGPPLMWPVGRAKFYKPGFAWLRMVRHPGFGPWGGRDFVETAADAARPDLRRIFLRASHEIAYQPLEVFFYA